MPGSKGPKLQDGDSFPDPTSFWHTKLSDEAIVDEAMDRVSDPAGRFRGDFDKYIRDLYESENSVCSLSICVCWLSCINTDEAPSSVSPPFLGCLALIYLRSFHFANILHNMTHCSLSNTTFTHSLSLTRPTDIHRGVR